METQTPSRKGKFKRSDSSTDVRNLENTVNLPAKQTLHGSNIKRNGSVFVFTAPSGKTLTSKTKTRLIFDPSNSSQIPSNRPGETSKILNSTLKNGEGNNPLTCQEIPRPARESWVPNLRNRPKKSLKTLNLTSGKVEDKNGSSYRETSYHANENSKEKVKCEGEAPNLNPRVESEEVTRFVFTGQFIHDKLPRRSPSIYHSRPSLTGNKTTPTSKLQQRAPKLSLSSRRHRTDAALKLKAMEDEEMQASHVAQVKRELWLDRQEKAYSAWLNFLLRQPMKAGPLTSSSRESKTNNLAVTTSENRGKREGFFHNAAGGSENEGHWRTPKRQMIKPFRASAYDGLKSAEKTRVALLQSSSEACLQYVCSVSDLRQRLQVYLDPINCEDVISTMIKLSKYVDDGRLKMKEECAILTDLALKEKAVQVLMNYNATWLRIGLYIVLGHNALVTKERPSLLSYGSSSAKENAEAETEFLKLLIEKHFLASASLAKSYASNKLIDGLYRPGYYESLGKVILKRFFLFVLALDKAKCHSALPITSGIDGLDGGSPLLFHRNTSVKASRQALQYFLLDVMHGEGDLLGHLATLGYQVSHVQGPLAEYDFAVTNLIENLRDGVRLCRLVQIMAGDASVLMRVMVPCEYRKKHLHNCNVALQCLTDVGVPLSDEEGHPLTAEDLVMGDRERTLSLLWNIFVHLQIPLLISKERLFDEIAKIGGPEVSNMVLSSNTDVTILDLMLKWIQAICATYGQTVDNFRSSFADGQAFWYLIDFYLPGIMPVTYPLKEVEVTGTLELTAMDSSEIKAAMQNLGLVQDVIKNLGNIPEVLDMTDFLEGYPSCNERNVIILLVFLSARLLEGKSLAEKMPRSPIWVGDGGKSKERELDEYAKQGKFSSREKAVCRIQSEYRAFIERRRFLMIKAAVSHIQCVVRAWLLLKREKENSRYLSTCPITQGSNREKDAIIIQSYYRAFTQRQQFLKIKASVSYIQCALRAWLLSKRENEKSHYLSTCPIAQGSNREKAAIIIQSYYRAFTQRQQFLKIKASVSRIQCAVRAWLLSKRENTNSHYLGTCPITQGSNREKAAIIIQSYYRAFTQRRQFLKIKASVSNLQCVIRSWLTVSHCKENVHSSSACFAILESKQEKASTIIQSHYRALTERRRFLKIRTSTLRLQAAIRAWLAAHSQKDIYHPCACTTIKESTEISTGLRNTVTTMKVQIAAIVIQCHIRGWLQRSRYILLVNKIRKIQQIYRSYKLYRHKSRAAIKIQRAWKRTMIRSNLCRLWCAAIKIQSCWHGWLSRKSFMKQKAAAIKIQSWIRGYRCRKQCKIYREAVIRIQCLIRGQLLKESYWEYKTSACKVQHCFRRWLAKKENVRAGQVLAETLEREWELNKSAVVIQAAFRGWREKQRYQMKLRMVVLIQAIFRGSLVRRNLLHCVTVKSLGHAEVDCTAKPFQLEIGNTKQERTNEAARTIQHSHHGCVAHSLSFRGRSNTSFKAEEINTKEQPCPECIPLHVNHGSIHDVSVSCISDKVHIDQIPVKYDEIGEKRQWFLKKESKSILKLQRWWREVLAHRYRSAVVIQSHVRGWASRRVFSRVKHGVVLIQACWRSYLVRKCQVEIRQQLLNLRFRIQNSAANVEDGLRLENRLTEALESLLSHKTVSGILHTCATLDMATQHSKRCCERLVAAGAIDKLLQLIHSTNRSAPHEEVLKHALSVLNNIAYHPRLSQLLVDTPGSINTIIEQLFRSKEEAFSKAVEVLKKLCAMQNGADALQKLPPIIRRLQYLAQNLERKVEIERRGLAKLPQKASHVTRQAAERRLREAISRHRSIIILMEFITGESSQRRGSEVHRIRPPPDSVLKRASGGPIELSSRDIRGRCPFKDCSNQ